MKKIFLIGAAAAAVFSMTACKSSSESAYKKAYEKAQAQQAAYDNQTPTDPQGYTPQQQTPVQTTPVQPQQGNPGYTVTPVITTTPVQQQPVQQQPVQQQPVQAVTPVQQQQQPNYSGVSVRTETVTMVNGAGLKAFSVVVGSFGMLANAQSLQSTLASKGYTAQIVSATVNGQPMYRVVSNTYDTKEEAATKRAQLIAEYPGAWLLYQK